MQGSTLTSVEDLLLGGERLPDDGTTLADAGITSRVILHARTVESDDDSKESDDEPLEQMPLSSLIVSMCIFWGYHKKCNLQSTLYIQF